MDDMPPASDLGNHPLKDIPIEVTVSVGHARPTVRELLDLQDSAVLQLDRSVEDPVELYVGDRLIARGILEEMDGGEPGQLAVRLTEVVNASQDICA